MARARSFFALSALVIVATTVAACTPSVSSSAPQDPFAAPIVPGQSARASTSNGGVRGTINAPTPRTGSGVVTVALVGGAQLPTETAQEFTKATGFSIAVVPVDGVDSIAQADADVVLGLDGADALQAAAAGTIASVAPQDTTTLTGTVLEGAPAAVAYGRDDVCVIADKSWMSANSRPLPTSFHDLTAPRVRALLALPDPASSSVGRAFVQEAAAQTGEGLGTFVQSLNPRVDASLGETISAWSAGTHVSDSYLSEVEGSASGTSGSYPLVVAPRSLAAAAATNTGADSYGTAVSSTCIARIMYAAAVSAPATDGAESLIAWLQGQVAQRSLATTGAAYPIDGVLATDTKAAWLMGISGETVVADETVGSLDALDAWLSTWKSALVSPVSIATTDPAEESAANPDVTTARDETSEQDPGVDPDDDGDE
ncbi:hypothetical protein [Actinomyces bouchesdurhonensis]|uniref:hypothetical protein n=1 Tax=Actinomyces bouchesdurhonensis TaxID=1852361 RepID=UPI0028EBFD7C|nr:hypothetical protein [Actinomyces bouchesdurhonensis]